MRVLRVGCLCLIAMACVPVTSAFAAGEPSNWAINGVPLKPGESKPLKMTGTSPTTISVPAQSLTISCSKTTAKGSMTGAANSESFGTGGFTSYKLSACSIPGEPACKVKATAVKPGTGTGAKPDTIEVRVRVETDGELLHPSTWSIEIEVEIRFSIIAKKGCNHVGAHVLNGSVDSEGPHENLIVFPETSTASTLEFDGSPATLSGTDLLATSKKGVIEL